MEPDLQIEIRLSNNRFLSLEAADFPGIEAGSPLFKREGGTPSDPPGHDARSIYSDPHADYLEDQWFSLVARFGDRWPAFLELAKKGTVHLAIIIDTRGRIPPIVIPPAMALVAADLNACIAIEYDPPTSSS